MQSTTPCAPTLKRSGGGTKIFSERFTRRAGEKKRNGLPIGTVSLHWKPTYLRFGEFYVLSTYRGLGIGGDLLKEILVSADTQQIETQLEVLKWNPVRTLYERHGFEYQS
jgi:GNAT superfamily N-acetyltransferase